jgi:hypothetical protein
MHDVGCDDAPAGSIDSENESFDPSILPHTLKYVHKRP